MFRALLLATGLLAAAGEVHAQSYADAAAPPVLRSDIVVKGDVVRIGDVVDNAGSAAQIAIYRAPDLGTTGALPVTQVLGALRAHQVIGVDTRGITAVSVTRLSRKVDGDSIELFVTTALEHRNGLGDAANLALTFDRDLQAVQLDSSNTGEVKPTSVRYDARSGRFDVTFEIASETGAAPVRLRYTGRVAETIETAVLARNVERNEVLKASDVVMERRPKSEIGTDAAENTRAVGMQARRAMRAGQPLRISDLAKPDLVQRDQGVTLIYRSAGLYLTMRGKALESGTEGDTVNVLNLQSKRSVSGIVTGRGEVVIAVVPAGPTESVAPQAAAQPARSLSLAANERAAVLRKAE